MRARESHETAVDIMRHNIVRMSNRELIEIGCEYVKRKNKDEESQEILRMIEVEQDKRGIY